MVCTIQHRCTHRTEEKEAGRRGCWHASREKATTSKRKTKRFIFLHIKIKPKQLKNAMSTNGTHSNKRTNEKWLKCCCCRCCNWFGNFAANMLDARHFAYTSCEARARAQQHTITNHHHLHDFFQFSKQSAYMFSQFLYTLIYKLIVLMEFN